MSSPWTAPGSIPPSSAPQEAPAEWGASSAAGQDARPEGPPLGGDPLQREIIQRVPIFPLRPLGLGEILGASVRIYRVRPRLVFGLSAIAFGIAFAITSGFTGIGLIPMMSDLQSLSSDPLAEVDTSPSVAEAVSMVISNLATGLVTLVATQLVTLVLVRLVLDEAIGGSTSQADAGGILRRRGAAAVGLGILISVLASLPMILLPLLGGIPLLLVREPHWWTLAPILIGLVLGALGALYVTLRLILATPAMAGEGVGPVQSLRRSLELTRGRRFWRIAGISVVVYAIFLGAQGVLSGALGTVGLVLYIGILAASGFTAIVPALIVLMVFTLLASFLAVVATMPFVSAAFAALYADARMRHEAWDVELLTAARGHTPEPAVPIGGASR